MKALYTIGYEGATLEDFLSTLRRTGITLLLDIREIPLSRRKGFSKPTLKQAVEVLTIEYRHENVLARQKTSTINCTSTKITIPSSHVSTI